MIRLSTPLLRMFASSPILLDPSRTTWKKIQEVTQTLRKTETYTWPETSFSVSRFFSSLLPSDLQGSTEYQRGKAEGYAQGYREGVKKGISLTALYGTSLIGVATIIHRLRGEK